MTDNFDSNVIRNLTNVMRKYMATCEHTGKADFMYEFDIVVRRSSVPVGRMLVAGSEVSRLSTVDCMCSVDAVESLKKQLDQCYAEISEKEGMIADLMQD